MTLTVAIWQGAGVPGDIAATAAATARIAARAAARGAGMVVFPEGWLTGYHLPGFRREDLSGVENALADLRGAARESGCTMVLGTALPVAAGILNAAVVISAEGEEVGRYGKRALFGAWEKASFVTGSGPLRFDCGGLRCGVAVCYDVEFPELIRAEADAGVQLVVVPTALMHPHDRIARAMVQVRAMESQVFLAYANRTGEEAGLHYVGLSSIHGPRGQCLAQAGTDEELILATLDPAMIAAERTENDYRPDLDAMLREGRIGR